VDCQNRCASGILGSLFQHQFGGKGAVQTTGEKIEGADLFLRLVDISSTELKNRVFIQY
jgi:hypothetical protein